MANATFVISRLLSKISTWRRGAVTREEKLAVYREMKRFIDQLLGDLSPNTSDPRENELRRMELVLLFETLHETALAAVRESLIKDLRRRPATRQTTLMMREGILRLERKIKAGEGNLAQTVLASDLLFHWSESCFSRRSEL